MDSYYHEIDWSNIELDKDYILKIIKGYIPINKYDLICVLNDFIIKDLSQIVSEYLFFEKNMDFYSEICQQYRYNYLISDCRFVMELGGIRVCLRYCGWTDKLCYAKISTNDKEYIFSTVMTKDICNTILCDIRWRSLYEEMSDILYIYRDHIRYLKENGILT